MGQFPQVPAERHVAAARLPVTEKRGALGEVGMRLEAQAAGVVHRSEHDVPGQVQRRREATEQELREAEDSVVERACPPASPGNQRTFQHRAPLQDRATPVQALVLAD
jgi:hypothetical protein